MSESNLAIAAKDEPYRFGPRDSIEEAEQDPRFDTFIKRLTWFQADGESDRSFAKRIGVAHSTLRRWKREDKMPLMASTAEGIARKLDVGMSWLVMGIGHSRSTFPDGKHRLTSIPRFRPWYQFVDRVGDDEPRSFTDCYEELKPRSLH